MKNFYMLINTQSSCVLAVYFHLEREKKNRIVNATSLHRDDQELHENFNFDGVPSMFEDCSTVRCIQLKFYCVPPCVHGMSANTSPP